MSSYQFYIEKLENPQAEIIQGGGLAIGQAKNFLNDQWSLDWQRLCSERASRDSNFDLNKELEDMKNSRNNYYENEC